MEKVDLRKGYWNTQRKLGVAFIFFEIISLESLTADVSIFLEEKETKKYFFTDFPRGRLYTQRTKHINKHL